VVSWLWQPATLARFDPQDRTGRDVPRGASERSLARAALAAAQQEPAGLNQDAALALARQIGNDRAAADAALQNEIARHGTSDPYTVAQAYAIRNDADKTFEWGRAAAAIAHGRGWRSWTSLTSREYRSP
jgi:hypothetical protein